MQHDLKATEANLETSQSELDRATSELDRLKRELDREKRTSSLASPTSAQTIPTPSSPSQYSPFSAPVPALTLAARLTIDEAIARNDVSGLKRELQRISNLILLVIFKCFLICSFIITLFIVLISVQFNYTKKRGQLFDIFRNGIAVRGRIKAPPHRKK